MCRTMKENRTPGADFQVSTSKCTTSSGSLLFVVVAPMPVIYANHASHCLSARARACVRACPWRRACSGYGNCQTPSPAVFRILPFRAKGPDDLALY